MRGQKCQSTTPCLDGCSYSIMLFSFFSSGVCLVWEKVFLVCKGGTVKRVANANTSRCNRHFPLVAIAIAEKQSRLQRSNRDCKMRMGILCNSVSQQKTCSQRDKKGDRKTNKRQHWVQERRKAHDFEDLHSIRSSAASRRFATADGVKERKQTVP